MQKWRRTAWLMAPGSLGTLYLNMGTHCSRIVAALIGPLFFRLSLEHLICNMHLKGHLLMISESLVQLKEASFSATSYADGYDISIRQQKALRWWRCSRRNSVPCQLNCVFYNRFSWPFCDLRANSLTIILPQKVHLNVLDWFDYLCSASRQKRTPSDSVRSKWLWLHYWSRRHRPSQASSQWSRELPFLYVDNFCTTSFELSSNFVDYLNIPVWACGN